MKNIKIKKIEFKRYTAIQNDHSATSAHIVEIL